MSPVLRDHGHHHQTMLAYLSMISKKRSVPVSEHPFCQIHLSRVPCNHQEWPRFNFYLVKLSSTVNIIMSDGSDHMVALEFIYYQSVGFAAALALTIYEYSITFHQEIEFIWNRKFNLITLICSIANIITSLATIGVQIASTVYFVIRIWIIWSRHWAALAILTPLSIFVIVSSGIYNFSMKPIEPLPLPLPYGACFLTPSGSIPPNALQIFLTRFKTSVLITSCAVLISVVVLVVVTTAWKSLERRLSTPFKFSILRLVLRNDSIYLFAIATTQSLTIFCLTSEIIGRDPASAIVAGPTIVLAPILLSRFILQLRAFGLFDDRHGDPTNEKRLALTLLPEASAVLPDCRLLIRPEDELPTMVTKATDGMVTNTCYFYSVSTHLLYTNTSRIIIICKC
ncbi:hypothetical protein ABKN59_003707 [Abortiporus biennis]